jgi:hypothetical protein
MKAWEHKTQTADFFTDGALGNFMEKIRSRARHFLLTRQKALNKYMEVPADWIRWFIDIFPAKAKVWSFLKFTNPIYNN